MLYRNLSTIGLFILIFFMPWQLIALLVLVAFIFFSFYLEGSLIMLVLDLLYLPPEPGVFSFQFFLTIISLFVFLVIEYSKSYLIVYNS